MENNTEQLQIGQSVWVVKPAHRAGQHSEPREYKISKIGRKYFELEGWPGGNKFSIAIMREAVDSNYAAYCHLTLQEILDDRERDYLYGEIRKYFDFFSRNKITLEQLRKIAEILEIKPKPNGE